MMMKWDMSEPNVSAFAVYPGAEHEAKKGTLERKERRGGEGKSTSTEIASS